MAHHTTHIRTVAVVDQRTYNVVAFLVLLAARRVLLTSTVPKITQVIIPNLKVSPHELLLASKYAFA